MTSKPRLAPLSVIFAPENHAEERRTGTLEELSAEGIFIASNTLWPPRTVLDLVLTIPGERLPVRLSGEVAWARTRDVAGMFVTLREPADHPTREKLPGSRATAAEFLARLLSARS